MSAEALILAVMEATWPPAHSFRAGPWTLRDGQGGGQRVSAATAAGDWAEGDIGLAEEQMRALGQAPLFLIRAGDAALDAALGARGYRVKDPVLAMVADCTAIPAPDHALSAFAHWPPLAVVRDIWQAEGIGAGRRAVMARAAGPKAAILGRVADRPAGAGFVAIHQGMAMLHALEVTTSQRRKGLGREMVRAAARWAAEAGADRLSLLVTEANQPARALYEPMGFQAVARYHYRVAG